MKALDKLIEILPLPLIAAIAVIILISWLIKELRNYSRYGETFQDKYWIIGIIIIFISTCMYYSLTMVLSKRPPFTFSPLDYAVLVSQFEGDSENRVQREIVGRLQASIYNDNALKKTPVKALKMRIDDRDHALDMLRKTKAHTLIWGSFTPANTAFCNVSTSLGEVQPKPVISQLPDIGNLESAILEQLRSIAVRIDPIEDQLKTLQDEIGTLRRTVDLLRLRVEGIESRQTLHGAGGKELHVQTSWPDFSRQRRIVLSIGINRHQFFPDLQFARNDAEELVSTLQLDFGQSRC
jgi:hypothetical protein